MTSFDPKAERKRRKTARLPREDQIRIVATHLISNPGLPPKKWAEIHKGDPDLAEKVNNIQERLISARTYCGLGAFTARTVRYTRYLEVAEQLDVVPASIWTKEMFLRAEFKLLDEPIVPEAPKLEWDQIKQAVFEYMKLRCLETVTFRFDDTAIPVEESVIGKPRESVVL